MDGKLFILGLGAQKAGTTWLHRYLSRSPGAAPAAMKEFHIWSELDPAARDSVEPLPPLADAKAALRARMLGSPDSYFDYFAGLLSAPGTRFAADITPAYAALGARSYRRIRTGFAERGIEVKPVFLMRDPVERCWSAVRMYRERQFQVPGLDLGGDLESAVIGYCRSDHAARRGRYDRTVTALEAEFEPASVHFGFFETLHTPEGIDRLSSFLGIPPDAGLGATRFNQSPKHEQLSTCALRLVAESFAEVLDFCSRRFPETRALWPSYALAGMGGA